METAGKLVNQNRRKFANQSKLKDGAQRSLLASNLPSKSNPGKCPNNEGRNKFHHKINNPDKERH
jgi:hypothetical protein